MKKLTISIVTPSYNQGRYIGQTLQSVLEQADSSFHLEYLIFDAVSSDNTDAVIRSYLPKFKRAGISVTYVREKDSGQSDAINKGLARANGDVLTYLNSDDYFEPGVLKKVAHYFRVKPNVQWAYGGWNVVSESGKVFAITQHKRFNAFSFRSYASNIGQPSCFFRRRLYKKSGRFNESLHLAMDYDMWLRFLRLSQPGIIPFTIANLRYYSGAKSSQNMIKHNNQAFSVALGHSRGNFFVIIYLVIRYILGLAAITFGRNISQRIEEIG